MKPQNSRSLLVIALVWTASAFAQTPTHSEAATASAPKRQLPDAPGKDVTQRLCGSTCHGVEILGSTGRTRAQWTAVINSMVSRGAKATDAQLVQIVDYLTANLGANRPNSANPAPVARVAPGSPGKGPGPLGGGSADSHVVDPAGAERGKTVYIAECITCHGNKARGANPNVAANQQGPDLVRSVTVLHDRYGSELGPLFAKGHPLQSGRPSSSLTKNQIGDLADFLHQKVYDTLRTNPAANEIINVLTGDAKAGKEYFNGAGQCYQCHNVAGDLAGIGKRYDPPTIQAKFLFPRNVGFGRRGPGAPAAKVKQVTVSVSNYDGAVIKGTLVHLDDFNVSLRDADGNYRAFAILPGMKIEKDDPFAKHNDLLDRYTDKNMHDIVAYLESLK